MPTKSRSKSSRCSENTHSFNRELYYHEILSFHVPPKSPNIIKHRMHTQRTFPIYPPNAPSKSQPINPQIQPPLPLQPRFYLPLKSYESSPQTLKQKTPPPTPPPTQTNSPHQPHPPPHYPAVARPPAPAAQSAPWYPSRSFPTH